MASAEQPAAHWNMTLGRAVADGVVRVAFNSVGASSGDSVLLTVSKTPSARPGLFELDLPAGTVLKARSDESQDLVVVAVRGRALPDGRIRPGNRILVASRRPVTYVIAAYCTDGEKSDPEPGSRYALGGRDAGLACVARAGLGLPVPVMQAAVWMRSEQIDLEAVAQRLPVPDAWQEAVMRAVLSCGRH